MPFDPAQPLQLQLRDATPVLVRQFTLEDRDMLAEAFSRLSPEASYFRFWTRFRELNPKFIDELCATDQADHVGWVMIHRERDDIPGLGGGSFWRQPKDRTSAEVSFTVADEFQGRGIGTVILAVLWTHARLLGIERFFGQVLHANLTMRAWWDALGATAVEIPRGWEMTLRLDEDELPDSHEAQQLRYWLEQMRK